MKTSKNSRTTTPSGTQPKPELTVPDSNHPRIVGNPQELCRAIAEGFTQYRLHLNGGAYSRKTITMASKSRFKVLNHIDGTRQMLTEGELYTVSNIGEAMTKGALTAEGKSHV